MQLADVAEASTRWLVRRISKEEVWHLRKAWGLLLPILDVQALRLQTRHLAKSLFAATALGLEVKAATVKLLDQVNR